MASPSSSPSIRPPPLPSVNPSLSLQKEIRCHEVAIVELNALPPSKGVYQKAGNIFFRKDVETARTNEQEQLDAAKAQLQKLNST
ncbi:uncharacterized protein LOC109851201 isoform X2 [Asparagus officinalis]|uniref:uncharacterized protein LOC109851201 isoform X2 n=1 Tax=Asparagus officinalis TaxID=4686 RepID=UPI00098E2982|nr:uncharacterized protein LOC109851201 isoform X2 [Asparagus officinalis]